MPPQPCIETLALFTVGAGAAAAALLVDPYSGSDGSLLWKDPAPYRIVAAIVWIGIGVLLAAGYSVLTTVWVAVSVCVRAVLILLTFINGEHQVSTVAAQGSLALVTVAAGFLSVYRSCQAPSEEGMLPLSTIEEVEANHDEDLFPDGVSGCCGWARAYYRMHEELCDQAAQIQEAGKQKALKQENQKAEISMRDSLQNLYSYVLALCPKEPLIMGIVVSVLLTAGSFAQPYVTGKLYDDVIEAARNPDHSTDNVFRYLIYVGCLLVFNYVGNILVGILFAVAAHTTITRLRIRMYGNAIEQDCSFYDGHSSGELSSRLINDSSQLQYLAQFTTQNSLTAIIKLFGSLFAMYGTHW